MGMKTTKKEDKTKMTRRRTRSDVKLEGWGEEKYGRKKKRRDVGKEVLDDNDENGGQRDRRRRRRGDGDTSAHPLLSLTLSPYSVFFSLYFSLLDILHYTHNKCGEYCPCSFGSKPSNKSSSKAHNHFTRQSECRSSPHSHLYSPKPHPKIYMIHCMIP